MLRLRLRRSGRHLSMRFMYTCIGGRLRQVNRQTEAMLVYLVQQPTLPCDMCLCVIISSSYRAVKRRPPKAVPSGVTLYTNMAFLSRCFLHRQPPFILCRPVCCCYYCYYYCCCCCMSARAWTAGKGSVCHQRVCRRWRCCCQWVSPPFAQARRWELRRTAPTVRCRRAPRKPTRAVTHPGTVLMLYSSRICCSATPRCRCILVRGTNKRRSVPFNLVCSGEDWVIANEYQERSFRSLSLA